MPQPEWSDTREGQYQHVKHSLLDRGKREADTEEIAARTVNQASGIEGRSKMNKAELETALRR